MDNADLYSPVRTSSGALSEQVARQIVDLIASRQLEAGSRLPSIDELTGYLRVSRTAVREATKLLDGWGVVTVKHGVGTFVAEHNGDALLVPFRVSAGRSEQTIRNLLDVRQVLEPAIAAKAAEGARSENIQEMEDALHTVDQALADPDEYNQADWAFHAALAKATGNDLYLVMLHPIIDLLQDLMSLAHQAPGSPERQQVFHWMVFEHVKGGQAAEARESMRMHLEQVWLDIQPLLSD